MYVSYPDQLQRKYEDFQPLEIRNKVAVNEVAILVWERVIDVILCWLEATALVGGSPRSDNRLMMDCSQTG